MTYASFADLPSSPYGSFLPMLDLQNAILESLMKAQQIQLQMLTAWQRRRAEALTQ